MSTDIDPSWFVDRAPLPTAPPTSGPLAGVPIAVKSNIAVEGLRLLAGSAALDGGTVADADSLAVASLRAAGASILGTLNMNELAYGFTGDNDHFGRVPNPHDPERLSGGSSSASAAVIAAGVVDAALGTDTNGSIRVPAALCGVWGLRPTLGAVPSTGVVPLSTTLDIVGPLAANAPLLSDVARALGIDTTARLDVAAVRVTPVQGAFLDGTDPVVAAAVDTVTNAFAAGAPVDVDWAGAAFAGAQIVTAAEAAHHHRHLLAARPEDLGSTLRARLLAGLTVSATDYLDALGLRDTLLDVADRIFEHTDVLALPTVAFPAPVADTTSVDLGGDAVLVNAALGRCTAPFSFLGLPSISAPIAPNDDSSLPVGVQLVACPGDDGLLLAMAAHLEATGIASAWILS